MYRSITFITAILLPIITTLAVYIAILGHSRGPHIPFSNKLERAIQKPHDLKDQFGIIATPKAVNPFEISVKEKLNAPTY